MQQLLTTGDAARLLAVRPSWVEKAIRDGVLPAVKVGRHTRLREADLDAWVARHASETTPKGVSS